VDLIKEKVKNLVLDMDGVLWRDTDPIGNLPAIFNKTSQLGIKVVLATNNATRTTEQYIEKLAGYGVNLEPWQIVTSGQAIVHYIQSKYPVGTRVHVQGEPGLMQTMEEAGLVLADDDVKVVVVGVDRSLSYKRLEISSTLIRNGAEFLATNPDKTFPTPHGLIPGAGSIIAAVAAAAETEPTFIGKPNRFMLDLALERARGSISDTVMVGDRLDTDILSAQRIGCRSCLVLSGVTTLEQAKAWDPNPDYICADLSELVGV
jgi:4-nitrophenyl phosphatase